MLGELKDKYNWIKTLIQQNKNSGGFSWYRFYKFLSSKKGRKRIVRLIGRIVKYIIRKITFQKVEILTDYNLWLRKNQLTDKDRKSFEEKLKTLPFQPKISVLIPVYNPPIQFLIEAIESVKNQIYTNWEICIADDCSTKSEVIEYLKTIENQNNIKVIFREVNGHISASSNTCIQMSTGEYVALLDQDDLLSPDALYKNVLALNENNKIDLIYSDEDKMNEKGQRVDPHFKPDWCPDNFLSRNYLGHLLLLKQSILKEIEGFREGYEGSQDYDLLLRYIEKSKVIHHIPEVLYHWRMHNESTAVNEEAKPYAFNNGIKALEDALKRRGLVGKVSLIDNLPGFYSIRYQIDTFKKVSIIIPSKDKADITNTAIESIFNLTTYPNFEVILISNNSSEESFFDLVTKWKKLKPDNFVYIEDNGNFNFSRLMNNAAKVATGDYLLLLNNDVEIIQKDWMTAMVEQAQRESIGVVGVKLLYSNDTVQHAGVVIGLGGVAGHSFVGQERNASGYFYYLKSISNYSALTAACILVKKETFDQVNGFDENLAVEFNDVDFCLKVKELGYNNIYLPHVELYHYESISRGHPHKTRKSYQQSMKEVGYFSNKWTSYIKHDPCYSKHLSLIFTDFRLRVRDN